MTPEVSEPDHNSLNPIAPHVTCSGIHKGAIGAYGAPWGDRSVNRKKGRQGIPRGPQDSHVHMRAHWLAWRTYHTIVIE